MPPLRPWCNGQHCCLPSNRYGFTPLKPRTLAAANLVNFCLHTNGTNLIINYDMPAIINSGTPIKVNFDMPALIPYDSSAPHLEYMYRALCNNPFCDKSLSITFVQNIKDIRQVYGVGIHGTNICELSTDVDPKLYNVLAAKPNVPQQYYVDVDETEKLECMLTILDSFQFYKTIIFVNSDDASLQ
uniref:Glucan endo-1,3-beta-D-glucosidase n=1 Tax=Panagrellus redivivus TaxID=6233 RepID=A0A7E4V9H4_PANRE